MAGDSNFSDVSLLLRCNGSNGSTTIADNSSNALTVTSHGNAHIATAITKFGGGAVSFDGNGDYLSIPNNALFDLGTADCTVEAWAYIAGDSAVDFDGLRGCFILNAWGETFPLSGWTLSIQGSTTTTGTGIALDSWQAGVGQSLYRATTTVSKNTWHHIEASVSSGTRYLFLDGVLLSGSYISNTAPALQTFGNKLHVGGGIHTNYHNYILGSIENVRITKGVARHTATFTPPEASFPSASGQVYFFNGGSQIGETPSTTFANRINPSIVGAGLVISSPQSAFDVHPVHHFLVGSASVSVSPQASLSGGVYVPNDAYGAGHGFKSTAAGTMDYGNVGDGVGYGFNSTAAGLGGAVGIGNGFNSTAAGVMETPEYWYGKGYGFNSTAAGVLNVTILMSGKGAGFRSTPAGLGGAVGAGNGFNSTAVGVMQTPELMLGKGGGFYSTANGVVVVPAFAYGVGGGFSSTVWHATGQGGSFTSTVTGKFLSALINSEAFVMNMTANSAGQYPVTRFTNYPFNNVVRLGGNYYGVKDDGFYLLSGDLDITTQVNGKITLKDTDFGVYQEKRLQYVYLNTDTVTTTVPFVNGVQKPGVASLFGGRRCKLPLGDKGRYWQLRIENIKKLEGIEFNPVGVQRKV